MRMAGGDAACEAPQKSTIGEKTAGAAAAAGAKGVQKTVRGSAVELSAILWAWGLQVSLLLGAICEVVCRVW